MSVDEHRPGDILVVDDVVPNLRLLADVLHGAGHHVRPVPSAEIALQAAAARPPELVLMDVAMPGMDGFTAAARLRVMPGLSELPVVFISASDRIEDKLQAFSHGGVDYLTKPFQADEVLARVRTHLQLARYRAQARAQNRLLEAAVAERTTELAAALVRLHQLDRAKHSFLTCINHTLRTPLNGMIGVCELVMTDPIAAGGMQEAFTAARDDLIDLIEQALLLSDLDLRGPDAADHVDPAPIADEAVERLMRRRPTWRAPVVVDGGPNVHLAAPRTLVVPAISTLVDCAMRLAGTQAVARLSWEHRGARVALVCRAAGARVDPGRCASFFAHLDDDRPLAPADEVQLRPFLLHRIAQLCSGTCRAEADRDALRLELELPAAV